MTPEGITVLLNDAWSGNRPPPADPLTATSLLNQVTASFDHVPNPRARQLLTDLVRRLHGFAAGQ
ncbi:hypothetical protein ACWEWX_35030 [Streptomyces asiaticus]